jgi:4-hydroxy-3-methylbut-2-en-1-yl diphosphate synthase IspG/GcpE
LLFFSVPSVRGTARSGLQISITVASEVRVSIRISISASPASEIWIAPAMAIASAITISIIGVIKQFLVSRFSFMNFPMNFKFCFSNELFVT